MALNTAFAAALNPAKKHEVRIWYLRGAYAKMDVKHVTDFTTLSDSRKIPTDGAPEDGYDKLVTTASSVSLLGNSIGFGKSTSKNAVSLYGIMGDDKKVCMISPTLWPLGNNIVATEQAIAASRGSTTGQPGNTNTDIVYFIKTPSGSSPGIIRLDASTGKTTQLLNAYPKPKSRLYAAYFSPDGEDDNEVPFLYYMQDDKMVEYNVYTQTPTSIPGITSLPDTTPMAVCLFNEIPYLFWFSDQYNLMYSKREDGKWSDGVLVPGNDEGSPPTPADSQSDLDVVATNDNENILIFYLANESENPYDCFAWLEPA